VIREMTHPAGGFYSTQDADSEGEEGKFFVWTPAELRDVLGDDADEFMATSMATSASPATAALRVRTSWNTSAT